MPGRQHVARFLPSYPSRITTTIRIPGLTAAVHHREPLSRRFPMITDHQVRRLHHLDRHGLPKELAAAKAGMSPKSARKYPLLGRLRSDVKRMDRYCTTRPNAFVDVWPQ